jgi:hypothetical protein
MQRCATTNTQESIMEQNQTVTIHGPADLVAVVPVMLGFHPQHSLVAVGLHQLSVQCTFRVDLPDDPCRLDDLPTLVRQLERNDCDAVVLLAYGEQTIAERCLDYAASVHQRFGLTPVDLIRVTEGRWYSPWCGQDCCPPEGRPVTEHSQAADELALASGPVLPDRDSLSQMLDPVAHELRRAAADAFESASQHWEPMRESERRKAAADAIADLQDGSDLPGPGHVAQLALVASRTELRSHLLAQAGTDAPVASVDLWIWVTRHFDGPETAGPATIAGYLAYLGGNGALASECLLVALKADPDCDLARLLLFALSEGIPLAELHDRLIGPD